MSRKYLIGFSNMSESIPFSALVREGLERVVAEHPDIELIVRDNDFDNERARANAEEFASKPVDLAIIYHIDERLGNDLRHILSPGDNRIPIIAVDIPLPLTTFLGIDNYRAGYQAGEALGQWIQANWDGQVDKVLIMTEQRAVSAIRDRSNAALDGLKDLVSFSGDNVLYLDGGTQREIAFERSLPILQLWFDSGVERVAVMCTNDDTAMGVLEAGRELDQEEKLAVIGQGANLAIHEFRNNPNTHFIASPAYFPERYGEHLIDLALRILNGERVPSNNLIEPICVTLDNHKEIMG